jgi:dethiobiotin synthetase
MMRLPAVFVTGTDTGVGKTVLSAALGLAAQSQGLSAVVLKPAQTGWDGEIAGDAEFCQAVLGTDEPFEAICPYVLREPLAPAVAAALEGVRIDVSVVKRAFDALRARYDMVIVEGAGGLLVPFAEGIDMAGLAGHLDLPLIVAARPSLGTLNHTLLTLEAIHRRGLSPIGVVISGFPEDGGIDVLTNPGALARLTPVPLLGVLPKDPDLDTEGGRPGEIAAFGPAGLDPLLGGTFSLARFRRDLQRRLDSSPRPGGP